MNTMKLVAQTKEEVEQHVTVVEVLIAKVFDAAADRVITDAEYDDIRLTAIRVTKEGGEAKHYAGKASLELDMAMTWMARGSDTRRFHNLSRDLEAEYGEGVNVTSIRERVERTKKRHHCANSDDAA